MKSYRTLIDVELIDFLKSDDHDAFTEIYNRYWDKLFSIAYHRLGNEPEAEEVVQNIFLSLWKNRLTLNLTYTLSTYLSVAVKYQVITRLALLHRESALNEQLLLSTDASNETTSEWLSEKELNQQIEKCINALPEKCKLVFILSREKGLSNSKIAEKMNISEKTVEGHITKALRTLRNSLQISIPLLLTLLEIKFNK